MSNGAKVQKVSWGLIDAQQIRGEGIGDALPARNGLVGRVLAPALQLWLRSLLDGIEDLQVQISGEARQILSGEIPSAAISARGAVYQGLHLSAMHLEARRIRIDIGQILGGKPLQPLEPFPVKVRLYLSETDLNASLHAPLLQGALSDLLLSVLCQGASPVEVFSVGHVDSIVIGEGRLTVRGIFGPEIDSNKPGVIQGSFLKTSPSQLQFKDLQFHGHSGELVNLKDFHLDLGSEVAIEELTLAPGQAICQGLLAVIPKATF